VDFRVIAATNQDLEAMVESDAFREDLYWRLNVFIIEIPPLKERPEDIPLLANHFLEHYTRAMNRQPMYLSPEALEVLQGYSWPGNVRELQNAIERVVVVGSSSLVHVEDLPLRVTDAPGRQPCRGSLAEVEKTHILSVLASNQWNITKSAQILEVDRGTLYNKIKHYGLKRPVDGKY
jgi:transcriptional regulator with PAS, ATPase and Fis domain